MSLFDQIPSFLDIRTWHELLAHRLTLCDREKNLLRHFHEIVSPNGHLMAPNFLDLAQQLENKITTESIDTNLAITFGCGEGLSSEQVEMAITAMAHLHVLSMELPQLCGPDTVIPYLSHPKHENKLAINKWLLNVLVTLPNCDYFRKNERPLRNFLQKVEFEFDDEKVKINAGKDLPIVLCHGNFCGENIIFCPKNNAQQKGEVPPADNWPKICNWELAYLGFGISDLAYLLFSSVNSSLRIQFMDKWVALYVLKFEQFRQSQRNAKGGTMTKILTNKSKIERLVKRQKDLFNASIPGQILRVLPKLATDYRKLIEAKANSTAAAEDSDHYEWKACALLGRMIGGFEMIRKDFE